MDQIQQNLTRIRIALEGRVTTGAAIYSLQISEHPSATDPGVFFGEDPQHRGFREHDDLIVESQRSHDGPLGVTEPGEASKTGGANVLSLIRRRLGLGR
jgi:hypothetical protein